MKSPDANDLLRDGRLPADPREGTAPFDGSASQSEVSASVPTGAWPAPASIESRRVPDFPTDALSPWLAEWVTAEAETTQTPAALAGCVALGVVSLAVSRARFRIAEGSGWEEPSNLYLGAALDSGNRKSAVFADGTQALVAWEREMVAKHGADVARGVARHDVLVKRLDAAKKKAARDGSLVDVEALAMELEQSRAPVLPRLFSGDVTSEHIGTILARYDGTFGVLAAEGGLFETIAGRYSDGVPNLDVWLNGHAGDAVRVDRGSRPPVSLDSPALTLVLTFQRDVLAGLARKPGFRGRGLLGRVAYVVPVSLLGRRNVTPAPMPPRVAAEYARRVQQLIALSPEMPGGDERDPVVVRLSPDARALLVEFRRKLEPRLGAYGDLAAFTDWAGKYPGLVLRLACLLHVADGNYDATRPVALSTARRAMRLGEFFLAHALAAFDLMGADAASEAARHVAGWLRRKRSARVSKREMFEGVKGSTLLRDVEALDEAIEVLIEARYLRDVATIATGPGRRSVHFDVNPAITFAESAETRLPASSADTANALVDVPVRAEVVADPAEVDQREAIRDAGLLIDNTPDARTSLRLRSEGDAR